MKTAQSLESLYQVINELHGPIAAKDFVSGAVYNAVSELQETGSQITADALEKILNDLAQDFLEAKSNIIN